MKKLTVVTSCLALATTVIATEVAADPSAISINFICPFVASTDIHYLTNFGSSIGGYGTETINGNPSVPSLPYFSDPIASGANIPSKLYTGSYSNDSVSFDSTTGIVSCKYVSSANFDPFTVSYMLSNAKLATVIQQTANTISLNLFMGVQKISMFVLFIS